MHPVVKASRRLAQCSSDLPLAIKVDIFRRWLDAQPTAASSVDAMRRSKKYRSFATDQCGSTSYPKPLVTALKHLLEPDATAVFRELTPTHRDAIGEFVLWLLDVTRPHFEWFTRSHTGHLASYGVAYHGQAAGLALVVSRGARACGILPDDVPLPDLPSLDRSDGTVRRLLPNNPPRPAASDADEPSWYLVISLAHNWEGGNLSTDDSFVSTDSSTANAVFEQRVESTRRLVMEEKERVDAGVEDGVMEATGGCSAVLRLYRVPNSQLRPIGGPTPRWQLLGQAEDYVVRDESFSVDYSTGCEQDSDDDADVALTDYLPPREQN